MLAHEEAQEQGEEAGQETGAGGEPQDVPDRARQGTHPTHPALRRRQRLLGHGRAVDVALAQGRVDAGRQPDGEDGGRDVDDEGQAQRPVRTDPRERAGQPATEGHPDEAGDREPGVRGDQADARREESGDRGRPRHGIRAAGDQAPQRRREEPRAVLDHGGREHPGEEGPGRQRGAERPPAAVAEPVEEGPDERREEDERRHRQQEEQRDPPARLVGRQREDGSRQRHGERGIPRDVDGVELGQAREPGVTGTVGVHEPSEPAADVAPAPAHGPHAGPTAPPHGAARPGAPEHGHPSPTTVRAPACAETGRGTSWHHDPARGPALPDHPPRRHTGMVLPCRALWSP